MKCPVHISILACIGLLCSCLGDRPKPIDGKELVLDDSLSNFERAIADLEKRIVADQANPSLYAERARTYFSEDSIAQALKDIDRAISLDSSNASYRVRRGEMLYRRMRVKEATDEFRKALSLDESNNEARLKLAEVELVLRNYQKSLDLINEALRRDPYLAHAYYIKGWVYKEIGDTTKAISSYRTAVEQDPNDYRTFIQLGLLHAVSRDPLALDYYNSALDIRPNSVEALYDKAMFAQENGLDSLALACYDRIKQIAPENATAWYNSGFVHLELLDDPDRALKEFETAAKLLPGYYQAWYNRGVAYERKGEVDSAASAFRTALSIKPNDDASAIALERMVERGARVKK